MSYIHGLGDNRTTQRVLSYELLFAPNTQSWDPPDFNKDAALLLKWLCRLPLGRCARLYSTGSLLMGFWLLKSFFSERLC